MILASILKTGQSVASNAHIFFIILIFLSEREDVFRHFIGLISDSRHKSFRDRTKQRRYFAFYIDFYLCSTSSSARQRCFTVPPFPAQPKSTAHLPQGVNVHPGEVGRSHAEPRSTLVSGTLFCHEFFSLPLIQEHRVVS